MSKPIFFTEAAEKELLRLKQVLKIPDTFGVKIETTAVATNAPPFRIGFDEAGKHDLSYSYEHFTLFIPKGGSMQLIGLTVDFVPAQKGFVFIDSSGL